LELFYVTLALQLGKAGRSESDGCLLAACNSVLVVTGGAIGFLLFGFPLKILSALAGASLLPGAMTAAWLYRMTRR
jgi:hypothetical protein